MVASWIILFLDAIKLAFHQGRDASELWNDALFLRWTEGSTDDCVLATRAAIESKVGSAAIDETVLEEVIDCSGFEIGFETLNTNSGGLDNFQVTIT